jgi:hypothetical protein
MSFKPKHSHKSGLKAPCTMEVNIILSVPKHLSSLVSLSHGFDLITPARPGKYFFRSRDRVSQPHKTKDCFQTDEKSLKGWIYMKKLWKNVRTTNQNIK